MSAIFPQTASAFEPLAHKATPTRSIASSHVYLCGLLLLACVAAVMAAAWVGDAAPYQRADPSLAQLLRGMALIKAAIVLGAVALLLWRFGWPVGKPAALAYVLSAALMAGATMLIWQLSFMALAAALFHIGMLVMLLIGWRDEGYGRQARSMRRARALRRSF